MDLSQISTDDLKALQSGDLSKVSTDGLKAYQAAMTAAPAAEPSLMSKVGQQAGNLVAGAVRGAGSIGATLLYPYDKALDVINGDRGPSLTGLVTGKQPLSRNEERRQSMDSALQSMGADPSSFAYQGGKLAGEIAGTAGGGGAVARGLSAVPEVAAAAPNLLTAIRTSGMSGGAATGAANAITRAVGGGVAGGVGAGLVDPSQAGSGAAIGAALPGALKVAGMAGSAIGDAASSKASDLAEWLMQSALKPTIAQLRSGEAATAVRTLLDNGINATQGGVNKLRALINTKNGEIASAIGGSNATIDKQNVLQALGDVRGKFGTQVSPTSDLAAIQGVQDDFLAHPTFPGNTMSVQDAQAMKQGTYSVLSGKYGQLGSAETEAQKGLARGLKDEIAAAVPGVGPLNAEESRLISTLNVTERRALMDMNKNPIGLAALAHNPVGWAAFMADKSALFKSLAARSVNKVSGAPNAIEGLLSRNPDLAQIGYQSAPALTADR